MAQPPPDVSEDDCLPEYRHLFCPDLLRDKVAFITGGGSGIGFRIAEIFMRHGCHTVIASRSRPRVSVAAERLAAATGQRCLPLSLDVRSPPTIVAAVDAALKEFGKIDILVNGAAGNFLCPAGALSFNAFKTVVDIDAVGTFNVCRVLYEKFFQDHGGVIINITATLGGRGQVLQVHAGSAKAAVGTGAPPLGLPCPPHPGGRWFPAELSPAVSTGPGGAGRGPRLLSPRLLSPCLLSPRRCDDTSSGRGMGSQEHPRQQPGPRVCQRHGGFPAAGWSPGPREHRRPGDPPPEGGKQDGDGPQRALLGQPPRVLRDRGRAGGRWWGVADPPQRRPEAGRLGVRKALGAGGRRGGRRPPSALSDSGPPPPPLHVHRSADTWSRAGPFPSVCAAPHQAPVGSWAAGPSGQRARWGCQHLRGHQERGVGSGGRAPAHCAFLLPNFTSLPSSGPSP